MMVLWFVSLHQYFSCLLWLSTVTPPKAVRPLYRLRREPCVDTPVLCLQEEGRGDGRSQPLPSAVAATDAAHRLRDRDHVQRPL